MRVISIFVCHKFTCGVWWAGNVYSKVLESASIFVLIRFIELTVNLIPKLYDLMLLAGK